MVYLKIETKNQKTYPDGNNNTLNLQNIWDLTGKVVVLSLILLLGYPKFWNYINGSEILVKPIHFKIVFTVCAFIIMLLYYALLNNQSNSGNNNRNNNGNNVRNNSNIIFSKYFA